MLPSLSLLRSFEVAAKHQSFTAAAVELRISQAVVSRQVRELERFVGHQLFRKEGRRVVLTRAGAAFARDLEGNLQNLRDSIHKAQSAGAAGQTLTIASLPTFSSHWLASRLPLFRDANPDVKLILKSRSEPFDLVGESTDVAIHFGRPDWIDASHTELAPETLVAVAAPAILAEANVSGAHDAVRLPLLHLETRRSAWPNFFRDLGMDPSLALTGDVFDQFSTMIRAAAAGLGAAIIPRYLVEQEHKHGVLQTFAEPDPGHGKYYAVTPSKIANPLADAFCAWLQSEVARSASPERTRGS